MELKYKYLKFVLNVLVLLLRVPSISYSVVVSQSSMKRQITLSQHTAHTLLHVSTAFKSTCDLRWAAGLFRSRLCAPSAPFLSALSLSVCFQSFSVGVVTIFQQKSLWFWVNIQLLPLFYFAVISLFLWSQKNECKQIIITLITDWVAWGGVY